MTTNDAGLPDSLAALHAARAALRQGNYDAAFDHLERSLALADRLSEPERADVRTDAHELYGRIYRMQGQIERAQAAFESMRAAAPTPRRVLDARLLLAALLVMRGAYDQAAEQCRAIDAEAAELSYPGAQVRARRELGSIAWKRGLTDEALRHLEAALLLCRRTGGEDLKALLTELGNTRVVRGEYSKAISYHEEVLSLALAENNMRGQVLALINLGECYQHLAHMETALDCHERALRLCETHHLPIDPDLIRNLGVDLLELGRPVEALGYLEHAPAMADAFGNKDYALQARGSLGLALLAVGEPERARVLGEAILADAIALQAPVYQAGARLILGRALLALGDRAAAYPELQQGLFAAQTAYSGDLLWKLHAALADAAPSPAVADVHSRIAAELVTSYAEQIADEALRQGYLDSPAVRAVLARARAGRPDS